MSTIPAMMKAIRVNEIGGSNVLQLSQSPVPTANAGETLVRVEYAGVNFIDVYKRTGLYKIPFPATLGEEGAGEIVAVGQDVTGARIGDRVAWTNTMGSYAEYAVVPAERLVPIPDHVSTRDAAAVMLQGMTAHYLAFSTYHLEHGHRCLIHAAAGGVGLLLVQIAKKCGTFVIGTAGTDEKAELARSVGADNVIVYTNEDFVKETMRITGGNGVHVVYDSVGKTTFLRGFDVLERRGVMVTFGQSSGKIDPIDPLLLNQKGSLFMTRPKLADYVATREELVWRATDLFDWIGKGELTVRIGATFPLERAAQAHDALEGRRTTGKVLLKIENTDK